MTMHALTLFVVALAGSSMAAPAADQSGHQKMVKLAHSIDVFGLNLLHRLELANPPNPRPKNFVISPLSISSVLSTLLAGSANETNKQINRALGYEHEHLSEKEVLSNYAEMKRDLNRELKGTKNVLEIADAVAIQQGYPILNSFQEVLNGEQLMTKNFQTEAHKATQDINSWVNEKTHEKIKKLFDQDLDANTVMVLLNAIYFKGLWKKPFEGKNTKKATFLYMSREGKEGELVDMMSINNHHYGYAHFDDGDLLEIPYQNDSISMLIFLPKEIKTKEFKTISSLFGSSDSLDSLKLSQRLGKIHYRLVNLHLPKFKVESQYSLNDQLKQLGMQDVFARGKADLSRINGKHDLFVSDVAHKAFIEVNEEGATAAAATGVIIAPASMEFPVEFNVNRPFLFMIYDKLHQLSLFTGVINKP